MSGRFASAGPKISSIPKREVRFDSAGPKIPKIPKMWGEMAARASRGDHRTFGFGRSEDSEDSEEGSVF